MSSAHFHSSPTLRSTVDCNNCPYSSPLLLEGRVSNSGQSSAAGFQSSFVAAPYPVGVDVYRPGSLAVVQVSVRTLSLAAAATSFAAPLLAAAPSSSPVAAPSFVAEDSGRTSSSPVAAPTPVAANFGRISSSPVVAPSFAVAPLLVAVPSFAVAVPSFAVAPSRGSLVAVQ